MTNTMPILTDGERTKLIDDCNEEIERITEKVLPYRTPTSATAKYCQKQILRQQIALAALTAEPVHQFIVNNPDHDGYIEWSDCNPDYYSKEPYDRRRILYTAPPVPALKMPGEERETGDLQASEINAAIGWNNCLAEVKRLNGVDE